MSQSEPRGCSARNAFGSVSLYGRQKPEPSWAATRGLRRPIDTKRLFTKAESAHPEGKKSCGDKALIHIASLRTGLYQGGVFCT